MQVTKEELISTPEKSGTHVVILGAGASKAAFPNGDANGKQLPVMDNLIEVVGLEELLRDNNVDFEGKDFEHIYSELFRVTPNSSILEEIEIAISNYFKSLELPDTPTLYDHILLSLKPNDLIATFNWDPFLFDAWERLPNQSLQTQNMAFLHGNVRIGFCEKHKYFIRNGFSCPKCRKRVVPTKLLYPIETKDYSTDSFIKLQWEKLRHNLQDAFTLTIFGYSAPSSDKDAVDLILIDWHKAINRDITTVHMIDIKNEDTLAVQWKPFYKSSHYQCVSDFYKSYITQYPRRSCEALKFQTVYGKFAEQFPLKRDMSFEELHNWFEPLWKAEGI